MKKAVGYTRVSSQSQASPEKTSLERQAEKITLQAQLKECDLLRIYEEPGISGATMERPALQELMADAEKGKFDVVIVWDISRFGRNLLHLKQNTEKLKELGISFVAIDNGIDTGRSDKTGELLLNILASIYEFELETIKARTSAGRLAKQLKGELYNGQTPYGYAKTKDEMGKVQIVSVADEVKILRMICDWYVNGPDGIPYPMDKIAESLNKLGCKTRKGKQWTSVHMSDILNRESYWTGKLLTNTEGTPIPFDCEPIITKRQWDEIRLRAATAKKRTGPVNRDERFVLDGLLRCGICGARVSGRTYLRKQRFYACYWHECREKELIANKRQKCPLPRLDATKAEKNVFANIVNELLWVGGPDTSDLNTPHRKEVFAQRNWEEKEERIQKRITQLKIAVKEHQTTLDNLRRMLQSKIFVEEDYEEFKQQRAEARLHQSKAEVELREQQAELQDITELKQHEQRLFDFTRGNPGILHAIAKKLWSLPPQAKAEIIRGCLADGILTAGPLEKEGSPFRFDKIEDAIFGKWRLNPKILQRYLFDKTGISEDDIREGEKLGPYWGDSLSDSNDVHFDAEDTPIDFDENAPIIDGKLTIEDLKKKRKHNSQKSGNP